MNKCGLYPNIIGISKMISKTNLTINNIYSPKILLKDCELEGQWAWFIAQLEIEPLSNII